MTAANPIARCARTASLCLLLPLLMMAFSAAATAAEVPAPAPEHMAGSTPHRGYAGSTLGSPLAFGMSLGAVAAGGYTQTQKGFANLADASVGISLGLGDPEKYLGLDFSAVFATLLKSKGSSAGFGEVGSLSVKLSRHLSPATAVAVGVNGAYFYGFTEEFEQPVFFANVSHILPVGNGAWRRPLVLNAGLVASGFENSTNSRNESIVRPFGSVAYYVWRQVSLIADYNGRYGNAGVSVAPFASIPANITLGAININNANDLGTQFGISASIAGRLFNR